MVVTSRPVTRSRLPLVALAASLVAACAEPAPPAYPPPAPQALPPQQAAAPARPAITQYFAEDAVDCVFTDPDRARKLASAFPVIDALGEAAVRDHGVPGVSIGVVIDGQLAYANGFGVSDGQTGARPDADTQFRIGSITKSFTALAVLALRDDGLLNLDEPITRLVPEAGGLVYPTRDAAPITLRQLLTHTSGLPRLGNFSYTRRDREPSEQEILASLQGFPLENPPGGVHVYSNLGFALLGIAVGRAAHVPLRTYVAQRILAPLGMTSSAFDGAPPPAGRLAVGYDRKKDGTNKRIPGWRFGAAEGAGGIVSTVRDMARFVAFELDAYPPRNAPETGPVRRSTVREAHASAPHIGTLKVTMRDDAQKGESLVDAQMVTYGFAWSIRQTCDHELEVSHGGDVAGFNSEVLFLPNAGVGIVVLENLSEGYGAGTIATDILHALEKTGGVKPRVHRIHPSPLFAGAMPRLLAAWNAGDVGSYVALLSPKHGPVVEEERADSAEHRSVHGACQSYEPVEVRAPRAAKFALRCDRGTMEMDVTIDDQGRVVRMTVSSRDVPPSPASARAASRLAGLVGKWDDGVYGKVFGRDRSATRAERAAKFEKVRAAHGACRVGAYSRAEAKHRFHLTCDHGGDLALTFAIDPNDEEAVTGFSLTPVDGGKCPVR